MAAPHPLACRCGTLRGEIARPDRAFRALCYCRDCRAYARLLGRADDVLDARGGTEVAAMPSNRVRITHGTDALACLSLSPRGLLRWHSACCRTPIANTPRNAKLPYAGVVMACLGGDGAAFGSLRGTVNTESTHGAVRATPTLALGVAMLPTMAAIAAARIGGGWKASPFFAPDGAPVRVPRVVGADERARASAD